MRSQRGNVSGIQRLQIQSRWEYIGFQNKILGKQMLTFLITLSLLLIYGSCCEGPTPPDNKPKLQLSLEDVSCQEIWLKLAVANITNPTVVLKRDGVNVDTLTMITTDTVVIDEGLVAGKIYTYIAQILNTMYSSTPLQVRTMDSTSHDWSFETYTLGDGSSSSTLYDVAIINDTLAYAVGEIWQGGTTYNVANWDGTQWQIQQLNYQGFPPVIRTIFAFSEQDIWFDPWFHWNGKSIQELSIDSVFIGVGVNKMWGSPNGELFIVGNNGFVAKKSSSGTWIKVESGTTLPIQDIWGATNPNTGTQQIIAVASNRYLNEGKRLFSYINRDNDTWRQWSVLELEFNLVHTK